MTSNVDRTTHQHADDQHVAGHTAEHGDQHNADDSSAGQSRHPSASSREQGLWEGPACDWRATSHGFGRNVGVDHGHTGSDGACHRPGPYGATPGWPHCPRVGKLPGHGPFQSIQQTLARHEPPGPSPLARQQACCLPKLTVQVRFPSPAPGKRAGQRPVVARPLVRVGLGICPLCTTTGSPDATGTTTGPCLGPPGPEPGRPPVLRRGGFRRLGRWCRCSRRGDSARRPARAVHVVCGSGRRLEVLVGPAGSGKTTTLRAVRRAWEQAHGSASVIGLAPSATAARELAHTLGVPCENTAKWLYETRPLDDGPGRRWRLQTGQLVIVDEASLASTATLDALRDQAVAADAKLVLVGDPHQLGPVEGGGAFAVLAETGQPVVLESLWRFAQPWEADATRRLRGGDGDVLDDYDRRGRLHDGLREEITEAAYQAWAADQAARPVQRAARRGPGHRRRPQRPCPYRPRRRGPGHRRRRADPGRRHHRRRGPGRHPPQRPATRPGGHGRVRPQRHALGRHRRPRRRRRSPVTPFTADADRAARRGQTGCAAEHPRAGGVRASGTSTSATRSPCTGPRASPSTPRTPWSAPARPASRCTSR